MSFSLSGKNALVCGASQGIGKASAERLAREGATVTLFARDQERLSAVRDSLVVTGDNRHMVLEANFDSPEDVSDVLADAISHGAHYELLVINSGGPPGGGLVSADQEEFEVAFSRLLLSSHRIVQYVLPGMKERRFGRIVNIISTSVKQPLTGLGVSNTIRGAVASWAKTLAFELGEYGITVNNVLPGTTRTARLENIIRSKSESSGNSLEEVEQAMLSEIPLARFAEPEEVAGAVNFLCSDDAAYITGINITVDGGRTRSL